MKVKDLEESANFKHHDQVLTPNGRFQSSTTEDFSYCGSSWR